MSMIFESLIPYNQLLEKPETVLELADKHGQVIILRDDAPAYVIRRADTTGKEAKVKAVKSKYKLHEAMEMVLKDVKDHQMKASDLADEIYRRGLYFKKDGTKAEYNQVRARCDYYKELFDTSLGANIIKLRTRD